MEGLPYQPLKKFLAKDGRLFFASEGEGVFRSLDSGSRWSRVNSGFPDKTEVFDLVVAGSDIYAAAGFDGVYRSADDGASWNPVNEGMRPRADVSSLAVLGPYLYAGIYSGVWKRPLSEMASGTPILPGVRTGPTSKPPLDPLPVYDITGRKAAGRAAIGSIFFPMK
jgi:hypothetical protein